MRKKFFVLKRRQPILLWQKVGSIQFGFEEHIFFIILVRPFSPRDIIEETSWLLRLIKK
jgi:hypothetical protein